MIIVSIIVPVIKRFSHLEVWMQRRQGTEFLEFAGGKVEKNESPIQCCVRETLEETSWEVSYDFLHLFKIYNRSDLMMHVYLADGRQALQSLPTQGWQSLSEDLKKLTLPANAELMDDLLFWQHDFMPDRLFYAPITDVINDNLV